MTNSILFPRVLQITQIERYSSSLAGFYFDDKTIANSAVPGQFAMLWIPSFDEIPLAFSKIDPSTGTIGFIAECIGKGTQKLFTMEPGDRIGIRGPFGNSFTLDNWKNEHILVVGGGVGMAPLLPLLPLERFQASLDVVYGARDEKSLGLKSTVEQLNLPKINFNFTTDDGSIGSQGTVVDFLRVKILKSTSKFSLVLSAGPEKMLAALHSLFLEYLPEGNWEFSLCDRYVKCGFGICGSCSLDDLGLRLCVEGPVIGRSTLSKLSSFGKYGRDASGRRKVF